MEITPSNNINVFWATHSNSPYTIDRESAAGPPNKVHWIGVWKDRTEQKKGRENRKKKPSKLATARHQVMSYIALKNHRAFCGSVLHHQTPWAARLLHHTSGSPATATTWKHYWFGPSHKTDFWLISQVKSDGRPAEMGLSSPSLSFAPYCFDQSLRWRRGPLSA